jgi:hypothetical protein
MKKVIVTTDKRGVFFGTVVKKTKNEITLKNAQMCVFWARSVHGVLGLAADGPNEECRITKPVPKIELNGVTAVMDVTPAAAKAWEACPWCEY